MVSLSEYTSKLLGISDKVIKKRSKIINKSKGLSENLVLNKMGFWIAFYFIEIFHYNFTAFLLSFLFGFNPKGYFILISFSLILYWIVSGKNDTLLYLESKKLNEFEKENEEKQSG